MQARARAAAVIRTSGAEFMASGEVVSLEEFDGDAPTVHVQFGAGIRDDADGDDWGGVSFEVYGDEGDAGMELPTNENLRTEVIKEFLKFVAGAAKVSSQSAEDAWEKDVKAEEKSAIMSALTLDIGAGSPALREIGKDSVMPALENAVRLMRHVGYRDEEMAGLLKEASNSCTVREVVGS